MSSSAALRHLASDPLWHCLCPSWALNISSRRFLSSGSSAALHTQRPSAIAREQHFVQPCTQRSFTQQPARLSRRPAKKLSIRKHAVFDKRNATQQRPLPSTDPDTHSENTLALYTRLHALAAAGETSYCRDLAEYLVRERREKPNTAIYNALILSNISHAEGATWRIAEYLEEMRAMGFEADISTCNAVLKVLSIHPDHLMRADILHYMRSRWFDLTPEASHDLVAGFLREGLYEQALERLDHMQFKEGLNVQTWLLDMTVYTLCDAGEIDEAYRIMRMRHDAGELTLSRTVWHTLLDSASERRHYAATSLVWNAHVRQGYINPSSGICLNILSTAASAGDAVLATDVFAHLSKRGTAFTPTHYADLITCYLSAQPPDLHRALAVLTIMALDKQPPTSAETRDLYLFMRDDPAAVQEAFTHLRALHAQGRKVPIAALNLIIECHVEQKNMTEAMRVYKQVHTFEPVTSTRAIGRKALPNIETFNLLLRGCRRSDPPDAQLAAFLISELLALRIQPTQLTYDRLILVFVEASVQTTTTSTEHSPVVNNTELLDWSMRHFTDMQALSWMPRFGTLELLAVQLARAGDERCWDVLQAGEDGAHMIEGWHAKGQWVRVNVEKAWAEGEQRRTAESTPMHDVVEEGTIPSTHTA
ncbi:Hypothetical protein R9X50_00032200 [Acrodontium crateriforme]|uniref:Pentatricopeptide repeat-containing protein-mitochondrial domain-containing protein n=1 Tax=Acrodontium crateriforme TaxID=150365 RepID=A0AAQ3R1Y7_9PEZI|nr:Hypothetical protein R9X50_00032200 [Acrodontium crateriforme]